VITILPFETVLIDGIDSYILEAVTIMKCLMFCMILMMSTAVISSFVPQNYFPCVRSTRTLALNNSSDRGGKKPRGFGTGVSFPPTSAEETPNDDSHSPVEDSTNAASTMSVGQRKLASLRAEQRAKKEEELRRVKELVAMEQYVREVDPNAAVIPERVASRMGKRMLPFVGIPLFGSMGAFVLFWYLATYQNLEFQPAMVATTTVAFLVLGLLGITYSVMSASWDPDGPEGSALGLEEFKTNVGNLKDGLARSKENFAIRDKMSKMSKEDLDEALEELSSKSGSSTKKKGSTFVDKIKDASL
jgi:hypothetical protein